LLEELAEIGMELARALRPGAAAGEDCADDKSRRRDPAEAFAPLSRAIRLTLALEAKTDQELRDLKAGVVQAREAEQRRTAKRLRKAAERDAEGREEKALWLVVEAAEAEIEDAEAFDEFFEALEERLDQDDAYTHCDARPLRETVERLCEDLMLSPDWSRWSDEGWIHDGPPARPRFSPFNTPSRRPILNAAPGAPETQPVHQRHDLE
jgi:hypothetical protein